MSTTTSTAAEPQDSGATKPKGSFLQHAAVYGLGAVSIQLVSIVLLPLYTNYMTEAEFGVLQLLYRTGDFLNLCFMVGGIQLAALNFWGKAESDKERERIAATVAWLTAGALIVSLALVLGFSAPIAGYLRIEDVSLLAFGIIAMMIRALTVMPLALMQARLQSTYYLMTSLGLALAQLFFVSIALVVFDGGVWGTIIALAITYAVFGIGLTVWEFTKSTPIPDFGMLKKMIVFSLPFIPSGLCMFVLHNGDQYFLIRAWGSATLGVYALGYRIAKGVMMFAFEPLAQVWRAKMYELHKQEDCSSAFGKIYTRFLFVFVVGSVAAILFQKEALMLLARERTAEEVSYQDAVSVIPMLLLAHFFYILSILFDGQLFVTRRTDLKPWIALASAIVMTIAYAGMIKPWGAIGAAGATLIGFAFHATLTWFVAQRVFNVKIEFVRIGVLLAAAIAVSLVGQELNSVFAKAMLFTAMLLGVWFSGLMDQDEKKSVLGYCEKAYGWVSRAF